MTVRVRWIPDTAAIKIIGFLVEKLGGSVEINMKDIDDMGDKMLVRDDHPFDAIVTFSVRPLPPGHTEDE